MSDVGVLGPAEVVFEGFGEEKTFVAFDFNHDLFECEDVSLE
jgi:hypothetical protein